jgi:hypothetical protein
MLPARQLVPAERLVAPKGTVVRCDGRFLEHHEARWEQAQLLIKLEDALLFDSGKWHVCNSCIMIEGLAWL